MADDPKEEVQETSTGAETSEEPLQPEQTTSEPEESAEPDQPQESEGEEEKLSERAQKRLQQLANERNSLKQENQSLKQGILQEETSQTEVNLPPWLQKKPDIELGDEVTPEQYQQHLSAKAEQIADLKIGQFQKQLVREKNLNSDIEYLETNYPELRGEITDKKLATAVEKAKETFKRVLKSDPDARFKDFIEPIVEARSAAEELGREKASVALTQQQESSAVRSGASTTTRVSTSDQLAQMLATGEITAEEAEAKYPDLLH